MLIDGITGSVKKNTGHPVVVVYGTTTTADTGEITALKQQFDKYSFYDVSVDYDSDGYINKVTILEQATDD